MDKPFPAYSGDEPYVFVCYAHDDARAVYPEIAWLREQGINIWYDEGISGGEVWRGELATAIENADALVYFVSPKSVASTHCLREIHYALDRDLKILPIYLEDTPLPADLRIGLTSVQALFLDDREYRRHILQTLGAPSLPGTVVNSVKRKRSPRSSAVWARAVGLIAVAATLGIGAWWLTRHDVGSKAPLTSIAVMPFDDRSRDGGEQWLGDALADTLAESLGLIEGLRIPGTMSTASLKREGADVQLVGDRLDVGTVIEGTVQRAGESLRVSVRWVRVDDESILWSATFPADFEDIFETQRAIAAGIAEAIRSELGIRDAPEFLSGKRYATTDIRAWEAVRRVVAMFLAPRQGGDKFDWREAERLALLAVDLDPNYAEAHAALGIISEVIGDPRDAALAKRRALDLDPTNVAAHQIFLVYNMSKWDYVTATAQFESAMQGSQAGRQIAIMGNSLRVLWVTGRKQEALAIARRAVAQEALVGASHYYLGLSFLVLDEPDFVSAIPPLERAAALGASNLPTLHWLALAYANTGREVEARDTFLRSRQSSPQGLSAGERAACLRGFEAGGWRGMFREYLKYLHNRGDETCEIGQWYALAGDRENMYGCLERKWSGSGEDWPVRNADWPSLFIVLLSPALAPYRDEPQLKALIERIRERIDQAAGTGDQWGGVEI